MEREPRAKRVKNVARGFGCGLPSTKDSEDNTHFFEIMHELRDSGEEGKTNTAASVVHPRRQKKGISRAALKSLYFRR